MTEASAVRGWITVHRTVPAAWLVAATALGSWLLAPAYVRNLGFLGMPAPIPVILIIPMLGGLGLALATENLDGWDGPDPMAARLTRAGWLLAWTVAAAAAVGAGPRFAAGMPVGPGLRNLLLYAASALVMVWLGQAAYAWAPSFLYTVTCMVFGYSAGTAHFYRWAVLLDQSASRTQLTVAGLLFIAAAGAYVAVRHR